MSSEDAGQPAEISVALVDDHRLFLTGFALLLERIDKDCSVEAFGSPVDMLRAIDAGKRFDLVICDLVMRSMNGLAFLDAFRSRPFAPVLMISGMNAAPPLAEMRRLDARGFVHKSADDAVLVEAIETLLAGGTYFPDAVVDAEAAGSGSFGDIKERFADDGDLPALTPRQLEIVQLISNGAANKEIGATLGISENTVKTHLKQIFEALRVTKRTACVRAARSLGIL